MLNGVYTPELSASIGKRHQFFHWKTPGAGSKIANSLTVEGNFRVPATRRATNKMADASISDRNLPIKFRTFVLSQCYIPLIRIRSYTTRRPPAIPMARCWLELRRRQLTKCLRSSAFYRNPPPGGGSRDSRFPGVIESKPSAYVLGFL